MAITAVIVISIVFLLFKYIRNIYKKTSFRKRVISTTSTCLARTKHNPSSKLINLIYQTNRRLEILSNCIDQLFNKWKFLDLKEKGAGRFNNWILYHLKKIQSERNKDNPYLSSSTIKYFSFLLPQEQRSADLERGTEPSAETRAQLEKIKAFLDSGINMMLKVLDESLLEANQDEILVEKMFIEMPFFGLTPRESFYMAKEFIAELKQ